MNVTLLPIVIPIVVLAIFGILLGFLFLRNKKKEAVPSSAAAPQPTQQVPPPAVTQKSNKGVIISVVLLLFIIPAIVVTLYLTYQRQVTQKKAAPAGQCAAHPDLPNYIQLENINGVPGKGVNAGTFQLPLKKPFTFSLTVKNNGTDSFSGTYKANFNKCTPNDLTVNPWKCTGPAVSDFPTYQSQTKTVAPGQTETFAFSTNDIVCGQRYQYDIFIPDALTQDSACGPDMSGLVEFTCEITTPTPTVPVTPTLTPTPTPTLTPTPPLECNSSCSSNGQCPASMVCSSGKCRNPECTTETSCSCPAPTPTPTPPFCNGGCSENSQCPADMICTGGRCRNPVCTSQTNCNCPGPTNTPKPTTTPSAQTKGGQPVAPKTPEAGTFLPTAVLILAGGAILILGAIL